VFSIGIVRSSGECCGAKGRKYILNLAFIFLLLADFYTLHLNTAILTTITAKRTKKPQIENLNQAIIEGIRDKKGKNIIQLDLRKLGDAPADYFIICEGDSSTHVKAISDSIYKKVKDELGTAPTHTEGSSSATWVLMDYFNIVVHVFHPETRHFYELENLWSDADITEFGEI
jgi:ribosome-associated protein